MLIKEGFISFLKYKTWYRIVGDGEQQGKLPLLCLHGGPGATHDYLEPLEAMAATGRRVIFYDQAGNGNSSRLNDPSLCTVELFVQELGVIRQALGLDRVHILGQSWGGMLAMEYAVTQPAGLASMILADAPASTKQWVTEINRLRTELPPDLQAILSRHEAAGTTDDPAYQEAMMVFYRRHVCRLKEWPDCLNSTFEKLSQSPLVYTTMWGPSEFYVTGTLKNWQIENRLTDINVPTLVLGGRFDEATPAVTETVHQHIRGSRWVIFENSAHMPHIEETDKYRETLTAFLDYAEQSAFL
jgi:proline-specific peptidase